MDLLILFHILILNFEVPPPKSSLSHKRDQIDSFGALSPNCSGGGGDPSVGGLQMVFQREGQRRLIILPKPSGRAELPLTRPLLHLPSHPPTLPPTLTHFFIREENNISPPPGRPATHTNFYNLGHSLVGHPSCIFHPR